MAPLQDGAEIDNALVARSRFIADYRDAILAQGAEFLNAKAAGLIDDGHIVGEIGEVLLGKILGREDDMQVTIYKSIGHVAQDLLPAWALYTGQLTQPWRVQDPVGRRAASHAPAK